jgi:hypothetical protein
MKGCAPRSTPSDRWPTCSLVIAEGANRGNPVYRMWMRKLEERWLIKFTPFGDRGAWQAAPGGAIV